jgi:flagellum-specific peptidoglycan hydrolase FlgJ
MVVSETKEVTPKEETKKKKTKKKEETQPTPTPTPTPTPPKEVEKETKEIKETKEKTKETKKNIEAKPPAKPPKKEAKEKETKPTTTKRPRIRPTTWEKFEKFTPKQGKEKKSWIKEIIERARKEPVEVRGLSKGRLAILIAQINNYNRQHEPKLEIKYDFKRGTAIIAPLKIKTY